MALVLGERELADNICQVKFLATGGTTTATLANDAAELVAELHRLLDGK